MYADDASLLNIGKIKMNSKKIISHNTGSVEQYFETNNLVRNLKQNTLLFSFGQKKKKYRQERKINIVIKDREVDKV
jgi:hypothetical protein